MWLSRLYPDRSLQLSGEWLRMVGLRTHWKKPPTVPSQRCSSPPAPQADPVALPAAAPPADPAPVGSTSPDEFPAHDPRKVFVLEPTPHGKYLRCGGIWTCNCGETDCPYMESGFSPKKEPPPPVFNQPAREATEA